MTSAIIELQAKIDKYNRNIDSAVKKIQDAEQKIERSTDKMERSFSSAENGVKNFNVSLAASAVAIALVTTRVAQLSDEFSLISRQIRRSEETQEGFNRRFDELFELSNDVGQSLRDTVSLYARLEFATRELNLTQGQTLQITETLTKAFKSTGLTAQEAASSVIQISQAFAAGRLQGDEFRSIAENAPVVLEALSRELNVSTGALKDMAAEGLITSEVLSRALLNSAEKIDDEFERVTEGTKTLNEATAVLNNGFLKLVGTIDKITGASAGAATAIENLGETMSDVADNISSGDGLAYWINSVVLFLQTQGAEAQAAAALLQGYIDKVNDAKEANEGLSFQAPGSPAINLFGSEVGETPLPGAPVASDTPFADVGTVNEGVELDPFGFDYENSLDSWNSFNESFLDIQAQANQAILDENKKRIDAIGKQEKDAASKSLARERMVAKFKKAIMVDSLGNIFNAVSALTAKNEKQSEAFARASIIADTASAIMKSLAINPYDYFNVAALGLTGAAQLASVGSGSVSGGAAGGGAISGVSGTSGGAESNSFDNVGISITDTATNTSSLITVRLEDASSEEFFEATGRGIQSADDNGRI